MKTDANNKCSLVRDGQRLDSWLWAARFFRTRRLAAEAVAASHVKLNGQKSKPGRMVKSGDQLASRNGALNGVRTNTDFANMAYKVFAMTGLGRTEEIEIKAVRLNSRGQMRVD